jgi:hypothetical protein
LRGLLVGAAIDEVAPRLLELYLRPTARSWQSAFQADCKLATRRVQQRHRHLAIGLDDAQLFGPVGATPPSQVDIGDISAVITHVGERVVQVVTH